MKLSRTKICQFLVTLYVSLKVSAQSDETWVSNALYCGPFYERIISVL